MVSSDFRHKFDKGMELKRRGSYELANRLFLDLAKLEPNSAKIRAALADVYWKQGDLESAISHFKRAVELAPKWELASISLFHCLWEQGSKDQAFDEMKRFMSIASSEDYASIVREINSSEEG